MKVEISMYRLWINSRLMEMFFRTQSIMELHNLHKLAKDWDEVLARIEEVYTDLDDFEEDLYSSRTEDLIKVIGKEYFNKE